MAQNIYDDEQFFSGYSQLDRQVRGLDGAPEWPTLRSMLPGFSGKRVLDLGCGFGWFSRFAAEQGAESVLGIDLSERMLDRARADTDLRAVSYQRDDLDQVELASDSFDVVFSSLALHYVTDLAQLAGKIQRSLRPGGNLVFSVEHPIFSANPSQQFVEAADGRTAWPVQQYLVEGPRSTNWFADGVIKEHRTVATFVNAVIKADMVLDRIEEWGGDTGDEPHRPWFLLVGATRANGG